LDNKSDNIENLAIFCSACKPGYSAEYHKDFVESMFIVKKCTKIEHCIGK